MRGLSLVVASGGHSSSRCAGLSLSRPLPLRSTGPRRAGSVVVAYGPSCSAACGIFPDQGSNPRPLHWQADSQPLRHQGSPLFLFIYTLHFYIIHIFCREVRNNLMKEERKEAEDVLPWASLVAQWLRICLPMQGTRVRALV